MATAEDLKTRLGKFFKGKGKAPAPAPQPATPPTPQPIPATPPPAQPDDNTNNGNGTQPKTIGEELQLVNYTPEQRMQQVQNRLSRVQFGWTGFTRFMEGYGEWWAVLGPIILLLGTIGEVFLVLWTRQKHQDILTGISIVAVSLVLEGTFLAVSFKAAGIRNRAEQREGGPTDLDKHKQRKQLLYWLVLAAGVCATQAVFVAASTKPDDLGGNVGLWTFAIVRSALTLAGDAYTAFAHEEKPSTGEQEAAQLQEEGKISALLLKQTGDNIAMVNEQTIHLHRRQMQAVVELDNIKTENAMKIMENRNRIDVMKAQQEQAAMFTRLGTGIIRAMFDPDMPEDSRQKILGSVSVFTEMAKQLPAQQTTIEEIDTSAPNTGDL